MPSSYYIMPGGRPEGPTGPVARQQPPVPQIPGSPQAIGPAPFNHPQPLTPPAPTNVLAPGTVRAAGPSQGFDPQYLQNLATAIGGMFANRSGGNNMAFNPLGNLSEISPTSGIGGNAPTLGAPLTWLQQALNGGGFSYNQPTQATPPEAVATVPRSQPPRLGTGRIYT